MKAITSAQETMDYFVWEGQNSKAFHKTFRIAQWPKTGIQEMWDNLARLDLVFRVKSSFWPSSFKVSGALNRKINRLEMNLEMATADHKTTSLPRDDELKGYSQILSLRNELVFHHETLVEEITFVTITSPDESTLTADCNRFLDVTSAYGVMAAPGS